MAKGRESFDRRQRERAKKAKAEAKRQRRFTKDDEGEGADVDGAPAAPAVDEEAVLASLAKLHEAFEQERIGFDEFEERRTELLARLTIE